MLTFIFALALIYVAIRMLFWGIKAMWGIAKIIAFVVLLPILIIGLAVSGFVLLAVGVLVMSVLVATIGGLVFG